MHAVYSPNQKKHKEEEEEEKEEEEEATVQELGGHRRAHGEACTRGNLHVSRMSTYLRCLALDSDHVGLPLHVNPGPRLGLKLLDLGPGINRAPEPSGYANQ